MLIQVGELSRRAGISVRTLHHYEHIGLLLPSARSPALATTGDRGDDAESLFRIRFTDRLMPRHD